MVPLKDILGKPGEGIHFHVGGVAIIDVIATIVVGGFLGYKVAQHYKIESLTPCVLLGMIALFVVGEFLHLVIGVDTTIARIIKRI